MASLTSTRAVADGVPAVTSAAEPARTATPDEARIRELTETILKATNIAKPYEVSIPLLGASYLKDASLYRDMFIKIFAGFPADPAAETECLLGKLQGPGKTFNAWILGRILVATMQMKDDTAAAKTAAVIFGLLKTSEVDCFSAWAWGYLAIYCAEKMPAELEAVQKAMMDCTDALSKKPEEHGKDNVSWAIVMELQSIAIKDDKAAYGARLAKLLEFTGTASVLAALRTIPKEDFRAWATALILSAARKIGDTALVDSLTAALPEEIAGSPSLGDQMLALAVARSE